MAGLRPKTPRISPSYGSELTMVLLEMRKSVDPTRPVTVLPSLQLAVPSWAPIAIWASFPYKILLMICIPLGCLELARHPVPTSLLVKIPMGGLDPL